MHALHEIREEIGTFEKLDRIDYSGLDLSR